MNKVDIRDWKTFKVGDLFDIHPTKHYNLTNAYLFEESGEIPVIVNSSYNNGVGGYTNLNPTEKGGIITFSDTTSSTAIFYQHSDFIGYSHVQGMYPKHNDWSEKSMLFFLTVFKKAAFLLGFDYVNKFTRKLASEIEIKLPVINNQIDFNFMEKKIELYFSESKKHIDKLSELSAFSKKKIDVERWKEFKIGDLFDIISPKVYHTKHVTKSNDGIPYIVRSKYNNGMKYRVEIKKDYILNPGGTISFGAENATFFYQAEDFISGRDMYYIDTRKLSKNCALFITTCLQKITDKYSYNYGLFPKLLKEEIIKLPVDQDEKPDWNYMESFIKSLPYGNMI